MNKIEKNRQSIDPIAVRKKIHAHPELSGEEIQTASYIAQLMKNLNADRIFENVGRTGVAAVFDSGNPGRTVMFRAELDALPIEEMNSFDHKSTIQGVSHKCGHDGHSAILVALAKRIASDLPTQGRVILLFQSAEETGEGAQWILNDPAFQSITPDVIYALHNIPGKALGEISTWEGQFTPHVISADIQIKGKESHASEPSKGVNPYYTLIELARQIIMFSNGMDESKDYVLITPIHMSLGAKDYGISPGKGELHYTIRAWSKDILKDVCLKIENLVTEISSRDNLTASVTWTHPFDAVINNKDAVENIIQSARYLNFSYMSQDHPNNWGEDFGLFTQKFPGAMFCIGAGENCPPLHTNFYDFPDELIEMGSELFFRILECEFQ